MRRFDGSLAIAIRREDGQYWPDETDGLGDYSGLFLLCVFLCPLKSLHFSFRHNSV